MQPDVQRRIEGVVAGCEYIHHRSVKVTDLGTTVGSLEIGNAVEPIVDRRFSERWRHVGESLANVVQVNRDALLNEIFEIIGRHLCRLPDLLKYVADLLAVLTIHSKVRLKWAGI